MQLFPAIVTRAPCAPRERPWRRTEASDSAAEERTQSGSGLMTGKLAPSEDSRPARRHAPSGEADTASEGDGKRPLRVYLVEDAPSFRERLADFLTETGEVEIAGFADSEAAALQDLRGAPPDVVIVDLHLREGSGIGVIASLRSQWPQRPPTIVVLTNYAFPEFESACRARGADHFYDKSTQFGAVKALLLSLRESGA